MPPGVDAISLTVQRRQITALDQAVPGEVPCPLGAFVLGAAGRDTLIVSPFGPLATPFRAVRRRRTAILDATRCQSPGVCLAILLAAAVGQALAEGSPARATTLLLARRRIDAPRFTTVEKCLHGLFTLRLVASIRQAPAKQVLPPLSTPLYAFFR